MFSRKSDLCDKKYHKEGWYKPGPGEKAQPVTSGNRYNLINEDISLPAAVLKSSDLVNNLKWMQEFADRSGVQLCPHGKTTMTPELFRQQLEQGAWGMTVATPAQAEVAVSAGARNVIMANQLVGKANMAIVANLQAESKVVFYCCVDSSRNIAALQEYFRESGQQLNVLIEFGVSGGRCGCRTEQEVHELAELISCQSNLNLCGIELYEGVIHGENAEQEIRSFIGAAATLLKQLIDEEKVYGKPILTGAGSAWYDVVSESLSDSDSYEAIIRPGCYLIHDTGIYQETQIKVMERARLNRGIACDLGGDLQSALEVWAYVISRPEPTKLVVGMGKRDVAFDGGLPVPERAYRNGDAVSVGMAKTIAVMDQHAFIEVEESGELDVGDIIAFSTSHPCLTFDKWRSVAVCDDSYEVTHWMKTHF